MRPNYRTGFFPLFSIPAESYKIKEKIAGAIFFKILCFFNRQESNLGFGIACLSWTRSGRYHSLSRLNTQARHGAYLWKNILVITRYFSQSYIACSFRFPVWQKKYTRYFFQSTCLFFAARQGIEPRLTVPKTAVLPLDDLVKIEKNYIIYILKNKIF